MRTWLAKAVSHGCQFAPILAKLAAMIAILSFNASTALAQSTHEVGGEASLKLPDLSQVLFLGIDGHRLLMIGILFCIFGLGFGLVIYTRLRNLPVHRAMREISELIYETCKTYLITQGKFLLVLWLFIAVVIVLYFGILAPVPDKPIAITLPIILLFSLVGSQEGKEWPGLGSGVIRLAARAPHSRVGPACLI